MKSKKVVSLVVALLILSVSISAYAFSYAFEYTFTDKVTSKEYHLAPDDGYVYLHLSSESSDTDGSFSVDLYRQGFWKAEYMGTYKFPSNGQSTQGYFVGEGNSGDYFFKMYTDGVTVTGVGKIYDVWGNTGQ
jgi:hypothetical protein